MAVISKHLSGALRFVNDMEDTMASYHRIRPNISGTHVESFLDSVALLRGEPSGNAYLTLTTELVDATA